jgi:4-hydroxybenzoate polyprenyltransferase
LPAKADFEQIWGESGPWQSRLILIHPIGVVLYVLITLLCAVIATHGLPPAHQLAPLLLAMALSQSVVGIANEVADRRLDAANKPWRPVAAGHVSVRTAVIAGAVCAALAGLVASTLSAPAAVLLLCGTSTGVIYSAWLKRTPLSWLPYVIAYPGFHSGCGWRSASSTERWIRCLCPSMFRFGMAGRPALSR